MPQIGPLEILTVAVIALVVFGPQRLPEIARNIGKAINEMRRMTSEMRSELHEGMSTTDADEPETPEPAKPVVDAPDEQER
ncbi:MAG: Sec-independent protein translocase protein TatB [Actinomycetota bacterium]|nr:Sec-independent protein translocase protein TatB [Actinomycetota bacterium]